MVCLTKEDSRLRGNDEQEGGNGAGCLLLIGEAGGGGEGGFQHGVQCGLNIGIGVGGVKISG